VPAPDRDPGEGLREREQDLDLLWPELDPEDLQRERRGVFRVPGARPFGIRAARPERGIARGQELADVVALL
jgi:hypothetical protein